MIPRHTALAVVLVAGALAVAGCGKQAELARPRPMFGGVPTQPTAEAANRDAMARRAVADAAPRADPRAPASLEELRRVRVRRGAKGTEVTSFPETDPSAPHPPGSPEELPPASDAPQQ